MISDQLRTRCISGNSAEREIVCKAAAEIERLRERVMRLGDMADCCVYDDLGVVCTYCRCKRRYPT